MTPWIALGLLVALLGATSIHLASAHQRWRAAPLPARAARSAGFALLAISLAILLRVLQPAAAVFVFVHGLMLFWILLPTLGAWRRSRRKATA